MIPSFISEISNEMKNAAIDALENEKFISILLDKKTVLKKFESLFSE